MSSTCALSSELAQVAFGEISPVSADLRSHVAQCGECQRELHEMQTALALLALSVPVIEPPAGARQRVLGAVAREPELQPRLAIVTPRQAHRWLSPAFSHMRWAAAFTAAAVAILAVVLLGNQVQQLRQQVDQNQAEAQRTREMVNAMTDPEALDVTMAAASAAAKPHGRAVYVPRKGTVVFLGSNLNQLPPKKSYQLWVIPTEGGSPIAAGKFKPDQRGNAIVMSRHNLPQQQQPKTFAVTIEPEEGATNTTPTPPMVLVGAAGG